MADATFEQRLRVGLLRSAVEQYHGSFSANMPLGRRNQAYYDLYTPEKLKEHGGRPQDAHLAGKLGSVRFG